MTAIAIHTDELGIEAEINRRIDEVCDITAKNKQKLVEYLDTHGSTIWKHAKKGLWHAFKKAFWLLPMLGFGIESYIASVICMLITDAISAFEQYREDR